MIRKAELVETISQLTDELRSAKQGARQKSEQLDGVIQMLQNRNDNQLKTIGNLQADLDELQEKYATQIRSVLSLRAELDKLRPPDLIEWEDLQEFTDYKTADGDVVTLLVKNAHDFWSFRSPHNLIASFDEEYYNSENSFKLTEVIAEREIV